MQNIFHRDQEKNPIKEYCLIGLSKFNYAIGKVLMREGHKVTVIDIKEEKIDLYGVDFHYAVVCDSTNIKDLSDLGVQYFDYVIMGISDLETSVISLLNLKELKVPKILCKARNNAHRKILDIMGISNTFIPEEEVAEKIAYKAMYEINIENFSWGESVSNAFILKIPVYNKSLWSRRVSEIKFLKNISANIMSIKNKDGQLIMPVNGDHIINVGDSVCLICKKEHIKQLKDYFIRETTT